MELTIAAQKMVQALGEVSTFDDLATVLATAEEVATGQGLSRIATVHIVAAMAELVADTDPMAPDYDALADGKPTSQVEDCRDSAEIPGAQ